VADTPASADDVSRLVSGFLASQGPSYGETEALLLIGVYTRALRFLPLWAIARCFDVILSGQSGFASQYRPKPQQVAELAFQVAQPFRDEARRIRNVLEAVPYDPPTPEQRDRVQQELEQTVAYLKVGRTDRANDRHLALRSAFKTDLEDRRRRRLAAEGDRFFGLEQEYGPSGRTPDELEARRRANALALEYGPLVDREPHPRLSSPD
jgi:hypothetical protein